MSRRDVVLAAALSAVVGALYLARAVVDPLIVTAAAILITGEALHAVIDRNEGHPHDQ